MKVIQAGIGNMGEIWIDAVLGSTEVEFVGFVEISDAVIRAQIERCDLDPRLIFQSLPEALDTVEADAVLLVTPPGFHKEMSFAALESGIPVLCEKPLGDNLESARAIVDKSDEIGVLHMVAQNYRYKVPVQTVKMVLDSGEMGCVSSIEVIFYKGPHLLGFHQELPYPLLVDMSIHHFDLMRFFLGSEPVSLFAKSWNPTWSWHKGEASASAILEFENDVRATYTGSWCSTGLETTWIGNWRFDCENGVILLRDDQVYIQRRTNVIEDSSGYYHYAAEDVTQVPPAKLVRKEQSYLLHEFYEAVTQGKSPITTCQDNIKSFRIVSDLISSIESREVIYPDK
ncbi:MAG: Gfo/Idh/MocA family oxidoreductase [Anaerolineales bacterium]